MPSVRVRAGLLVLVGLLLVTNTVWLFPHEDDLRYTYERKRIDVENGTLTYHGRSGTLFGGEYSDLNALGCQFADPDGRACAFDEYLVTHGPIATSKQNASSRIPEFVRLESGYYRRIHRHNESTSTYDVERVTPREFLEAVAVNLTGVRPGDLDEGYPLDVRLAVEGGTTTSFDDIEDDELGRIYRRGGRYYTVVVTDQESVDPPFPLPDGVRRSIELVGILSLLAATVLILRHTEWTRD